MNQQDRREKRTVVSDKDLYKISKSSIQEFIKKERRHDELDRLREVQAQSRMWKRTVAFCGFLNLVLISLALWGMM